MSNKVYSIPVDGDINERLKEFNAKLPANERIVHTAPSGNYLFITTEKKELMRPNREHSDPTRPKNLLLDSLKRG